MDFDKTIDKSLFQSQRHLSKLESLVLQNKSKIIAKTIDWPTVTKFTFTNFLSISKCITIQKSC